MIIFLPIKPKHRKPGTAGCILPTGQKARASKFTLRLEVIIHQLSDSHCTRILIANLLLASMSICPTHCAENTFIQSLEISYIFP